VEDEEGEYGMDVLMKAADLFERDTRTPILPTGIYQEGDAQHMAPLQAGLGAKRPLS